MINNILLTITCQFSYGRACLDKFEKNANNAQEANNEFLYVVPKNKKYYSTKEIKVILNMSIVKQVEHLIKSSHFWTSKDNYLTSFNEFMCSVTLLNLLSLYLTNKAS